MTISGRLTEMTNDRRSNRHYRFGEHGWPRTGIHRPRKQRRDRRRRRRQEVYRVQRPREFSIREFAIPENLSAVFRILSSEGGPAPGIDGLTYDDFSPGDLYEMLRQVSRAIIEETYRPYPTRLVRIPKDDDRYRELRLAIVADRVVAKALQLSLADYWRGVLPGVRISVWETLARIEREMLDRGWYVLTPDDVRKAFPSARIADVIADHQEHIDQPDLLRLIETVIRGHEGPDRTVGLDQGCPYSPIAMELRLHNGLDRQLRAAHPDHPPLHRYVDNLTFVCSGVPEGRVVLQQAGNILEPQGLILKDEDGDPVDVREPGTDCVVLGLIPQWEGDHLGFHLPEAAYADLRERLLQAHENPDPVQSAQALVRGWFSVLGPVFVDTGMHSILSRVRQEASRLGFRELRHSELLRIAVSSRDRWLELRQEIQREEVRCDIQRD